MLRAPSRQKAFDAGCDGFVAKPVRSDELFAEVRRVLSARGISGRLSSSPDEVQAQAAASGEAEDSGPDALVAELRGEYMAALAGVLAEFDALVAQQDAAGLGGLGHRLKGNGASYGFPEISELGAQIEQLGKAGEPELIVPLIERLRRIHNEFSRAQQPAVAPAEG
jgi:HPt (histidine-containing phosphotransfer) domain-containing protein